ncbi:RNA-dependent RNA polymerase1 (RDR1) [Phytophthora cinnamomi]|uniref:RNA-dependent RNA polymerase1 (RDR1) n=1 Tax=Phytophthora cinnamomi TaxID=4785 RepID=UPI00355998ED|nr:RNA-dependent RNA polymerase1 (RDR1) [Phytophthora cinnamomi]
MTVAGVGVAPSDQAWGIACKRCDGLVARHSQLAFLLENATAVHLTLNKRLLHDEQLREPQGESWRVYSREDVLPPLQFTKVRTKNAYKRERLPFELCCAQCDAKIASEGFLDELDESQLLLDSKACSCVLDRQTPYGMVAGTKARKWAVILRQLQELKLPLKIQKLQELIESNQDGGEEEEDEELNALPVVHPTEATIRSHFNPRAKMSKLRRYQVELTLSALLENTIVYLPTGCGKTLVAIKVMEEMKHLNPEKLVVFFVPTGPLVSQQAAYIRRESDFKVAEFSGQHGRTTAATSAPIKVGGEFDAVVVTPQYFLNLLFNGRTSITDYSTMVFDEAHHATGNHPYCELLKNLATVDLRVRPHILALTASPFGEAVREASGPVALKKLAEAFDAVVNAPTIAAEDLEASFIPKEAQWVTVQEDESERKLREGIKRYIMAFYADIARLLNGQVMPFETNYDTNDMELSQFLAKLRLLLTQAESMERRNNGNIETTGVEKSKRQPSDLELILEHLQISGPGDAVQRIEEHIRMIEQELGARMPYRSNRNFHHEGSSLVLFEGAESQQEKIGFQDYFGERHSEHNNIRLHQAHLICFMNGRQWYDHAGATFCAKFIQQMIKLSRYEHLNPGLTKAKAFVRFGHHYLINLPRSFDEETIMLASIKKLEDEFERGRTARELYESVLIAKQRQRAHADDEVELGASNQAAESSGNSNDDEQAVWGEYSDEEDGWIDYDNDTGGSGGGGRRRRPRRPRMNLQKAVNVARGDKGVTHSFYSMIEQQHAPWTKKYAEKRLGMTLVTSRPSRWFSATLKMRQEMDEESDMMDSTPDIRFYVSTTEEMPKTDSLYVKLSDCCQSAPDGRGILEFCDESRDKVRISRYLVDAGESPACIGTVRHVRGATYANTTTETELSLMHIREFGVPDRNPEDGFMSVRDKVEAEFRLPPLTPERRLQPTFPREFLATGMRFVDYLRTQTDMEAP